MQTPELIKTVPTNPADYYTIMTESEADDMTVVVAHNLRCQLPTIIHGNGALSDIIGGRGTAAQRKTLPMLISQCASGPVDVDPWTLGPDYAFDAVDESIYEVNCARYFADLEPAGYWRY